MCAMNTANILWNLLFFLRIASMAEQRPMYFLTNAFLLTVATFTELTTINVFVDNLYAHGYAQHNHDGSIPDLTEQEIEAVEGHTR